MELEDEQRVARTEAERVVSGIRRGVARCWGAPPKVVASDGRRRLRSGRGDGGRALRALERRAIA